MQKDSIDFVPALADSRLSLRPIESSDIEQLLTISFYNGTLATSLQDAENMHHKINQDILEGNSIHWVIVEKSSNKIAGTCGFYRGFAHGLGELGCVLLPAFKGKGIMTAALILAIEYGFQRSCLKKIWAATSSDNLKATQLLEGLKFKKVGELNGEVQFELISDRINLENLGE